MNVTRATRGSTKKHLGMFADTERGLEMVTALFRYCLVTCPCHPDLVALSPRSGFTIATINLATGFGMVVVVEQLIASIVTNSA